MFNFQPSPELMKQMLGGMPQQPMGMPTGAPNGNTGITGGMNLGMPMQQGGGLDVGAGMGMGMSHPMPMLNRQPLPMPPQQPPIMAGMNRKPMPMPPTRTGGGMMQKYASMAPSSSQIKTKNPNQRRSF